MGSYIAVNVYSNTPCPVPHQAQSSFDVFIKSIVFTPIADADS